MFRHVQTLGQTCDNQPLPGPDVTPIRASRTVHPRKALNARLIEGLPDPLIDNVRYNRQMAIDNPELRSTGAGIGPAGPGAVAALFQSLSDDTRLKIVRRLAHGEARVADLVGELGLAQSTVSAHVACLRGCRLVEGRPEGRQVFYALARPEVMDLLATTEALLAVSGNAVASCPNYGVDAANISGALKSRADTHTDGSGL